MERNEMKICSLRNENINNFLSRCVYSDILNRKYEKPWQKSEHTHREKTYESITTAYTTKILCNRNVSYMYVSKAPSTRIRIFLNPQLFLSGYENIRVHTLRDHSVFMSNSPVHTYSDSLRIH